MFWYMVMEELSQIGGSTVIEGFECEEEDLK